MTYPRPPLYSLLALLALSACSGDDKSGESETTTAGTTDATTTTATTTMSTTEATTTTSTSTSETTTTGSTTETTTSDTTTTGEPACEFPPVAGEPSFVVTEVASGFDRPLLVRSDPSNPDRLFVVEQGGHIKILEPGMTSAPADDFLFVDVENAMPVTVGPEQGLLGFAFHPDFPADPRVYINYNPNGPSWQPTVIDEYTLDANDPNKVDPASRRRVIEIHQPASNHNGGMITFGPDGYLYIGMGDGGGADDVFNTGRDPKVLHAKILRIGVEPDGTPDVTIACNGCPSTDGLDYTIPADNPFVGDDAYLPEIWALGVRNPWRMEFDRETGWLYAADVGQGKWEEVDVIVGGGDYGWSDMEGAHCFGGAMCDESATRGMVNADGLTMPIAEYEQTQGRCSITGGAVYRGCQAEGWDGLYFYGDYCTGEMWALRWDGQNIDEYGVVATTPDRIFGSGIDGHGRVLFTTVETDAFNTPVDGKVIRIDPM